jgi:hypothetical protein
VIVPQSVKIASIPYRVILDESLRAHEEHGTANYTMAQIRLDSFGTPERIRKTFWHEVLEAMDFEYHIRLDHDQIERLETAIDQFVEDNLSA